jgi:predicted transcriptional regulator of viral defense system
MKRDPRENARVLYQAAAAQGGYFTAAQARQAGYAYSQQSFHVSRGNWLKIDRGLFRLRDFPPAEREDLIRWSLWSRDQKGVPQAVVSHDTALTVHDLSDAMPARVHLTVPPGFRKKMPPGCVLHKATLVPEDVESRTGYRVTTPLRTLLDVSGSPLSQEHLNKAVRDALERGLVHRRLLETVPCSPDARRRLDRALAAAQQEAVEWNSPSETEKAPQGLI